MMLASENGRISRERDQYTDEGGQQPIAIAGTSASVLFSPHRNCKPS
jgi:hypothetical protein